MSCGVRCLQVNDTRRTGWLPFTLVVRQHASVVAIVCIVLTRDVVPRNVVVSYVVWLLATRTAKLLPHLWYRPQDIIHVPAFILFGYYFAVMKLYALLTLHEVR